MLSNYLFYISPIAAFITFLASLTIFLRPSQHEPWLKVFSVFLFINFLLDSTLDFLAMHALNNVFFGNLVDMFGFSFYLYLVRRIVQGRKAKQVFKYFQLFYILAAVINLFLVQKTVAFNTMTYCLGCLLIVSSSIYYFWELFQLRTSVNLLRQPSFWICSGLLFFYACSFPMQGLLNFINTMPKLIIQNLLIIYILLNSFLYLSFTIAFLCRLKTRKSM
ncbi:MAG TPA: hypothetical protein VL727_20970 [Puia sp.]|jgi:hypothetical protein|nr:hypothetical protein [Puia sp.]